MSSTSLSAEQQAAALELFQRRSNDRTGPRLPEVQRPQDIASALAIQNAVRSQLVANGDRVAGWKCIVPNSEKTIIAPIYASRTYTQGNAAKVFAVNHLRLEPEIGYVFGNGLPARSSEYSPAEIMTAVTARHSILEICSTRYDDGFNVPYPEMLADGQANQGLIIGDAWAADAVIPTQYTLTLSIDGEANRTFDARHPDGDPQPPLYWLANYLSAQGIGIEPGQIVITGSHAGMIEVPINKALTFDYGGLRSIKTTLVAA